MVICSNKKKRKFVLILDVIYYFRDVYLFDCDYFNIITLLLNYQNSCAILFLLLFQIAMQSNLFVLIFSQ